jgi:hypothetical protein
MPRKVTGLLAVSPWYTFMLQYSWIGSFQHRGTASVQKFTHLHRVKRQYLSQIPSTYGRLDHDVSVMLLYNISNIKGSTEQPFLRDFKLNCYSMRTSRCSSESCHEYHFPLQWCSPSIYYQMNCAIVILK